MFSISNKRYLFLLFLFLGEVGFSDFLCCVAPVITSITFVKEFLDEYGVSGSAAREYQKLQLGGYLGLIVGDMFGMPLECKPRSECDPKIKNFLTKTSNTCFGFDAAVGTFSDDSSMALCVADVLSEKPQPTSEDFHNKFCEWAYDNKWACYAKLFANKKAPLANCWAIGVNIKNALLRIAKLSENPSNGCLMRNYPVVINQDRLACALDLSLKQSGATHKCSTVDETSKLLTTVCWELIRRNQNTDFINKKYLGVKHFMVQTILNFNTSDQTINEYIQPRVRALGDLYKQGHGFVDVANLRLTTEDEYFNNQKRNFKRAGDIKIGKDTLGKFYKEEKNVIEGDENGHARQDGPAYFICSAGSAGASFVAAIWAILATESFDDAIIAAANLGNDADTVAAIAGQIAGTIYGAENIRLKAECGEYWLNVMPEKYRNKIFDLYRKLVPLPAQGRAGVSQSHGGRNSHEQVGGGVSLSHGGRTNQGGGSDSSATDSSSKIPMFAALTAAALGLIAFCKYIYSKYFTKTRKLKLMQKRAKIGTKNVAKSAGT